MQRWWENLGTNEPFHLLFSQSRSSLLGPHTILNLSNDNDADDDDDDDNDDFDSVKAIIRSHTVSSQVNDLPAPSWKNFAREAQVEKSEKLLDVKYTHPFF